MCFHGLFFLFLIKITLIWNFSFKMLKLLFNRLLIVLFLKISLIKLLCFTLLFIRQLKFIRVERDVVFQKMKLLPLKISPLLVLLRTYFHSVLKPQVLLSVLARKPSLLKYLFLNFIIK